ncbi:MAG: benzoate-CoA ligase family protein, partial [Candidatus Eremiobacteraeota bacterium]|nr:benzoate-CoA ligase family protein [Candidatus Eremiobacteraeota bacterium]
MIAADHLPERFNAAHWFLGRHVEEGRGERVALISDEGSTTYAALDRGARGFAGSLLAGGVHPGERVVLILPDGAAFATAFWG